MCNLSKETASTFSPRMCRPGPLTRILHGIWNADMPSSSCSWVTRASFVLCSCILMWIAWQIWLSPNKRSPMVWLTFFSYWGAHVPKIGATLGCTLDCASHECSFRKGLFKCENRAEAARWQWPQVALLSRSTAPMNQLWNLSVRFLENNNSQREIYRKCEAVGAGGKCVCVFSLSQNN